MKCKCATFIFIANCNVYFPCNNSHIFNVTCILATTFYFYNNCASFANSK